MDTLFLYNTKTLKEKFKTKVFAGDNHITKIAVQIPDNIGGYPKRECEFNLRAIIPEGNLSYIINPSQPYFYVTNDITEKAQTVKLMMIITHEGNVIGRTNTVDLIVNEPAEAPDPPLTPRAEFDEVIAEQRAEIAEQAETISEQATQIEAKDGQISELSDEITEKDGQITELNTENTRLENQHETDYKTIGILSGEYIKPQGKITFTENRNDVDIKEYAYADVDVPQPSGTIEITRNGLQNVNGYEYANVNVIDNVVVELITGTLEEYTLPQGVETIRISGFRELRSLFNINFNTELKTIQDSAFRGCVSLQQVILPHGLTLIEGHAFETCPNLDTVFLPNTLTAISQSAFYDCTSLTELTLAQGFNCNGLNVSASTLFTAETIVACLEALADRTGQTAYTITFGATNINKLTAEQRAIATNKNWNLA